MLVTAGLLLIGLGRLLTDDTDRPPLFPSTTAVSDTVALPDSTTSTTAVGSVAPPTTFPLSEIGIISVVSVDPFGGGDENDDRLANMVDDDPDTIWRTERYRDPLPLLKPGVGVAFTLDANPTEIVITGMDAGTGYEVAWSPGQPDPETWEVAVRGQVGAGTPRHQLPNRTGGTWVLWFTELPFLAVDDHSTRVAEVRFRG